MNDRSRPEAAPANTAGEHVRNDSLTSPRQAHPNPLDARGRCPHGIPTAARCEHCPGGYAIPDTPPPALHDTTEDGPEWSNTPEPLLGLEPPPRPATTPARDRAASAPLRGDVPMTSLHAYDTARQGRSIAAAVFALLRARPSTDDELVLAYQDAGYPPRTPQRIRSTRAELVKSGHVHQVGRRASALGNPATVWGVR